MVSVDGSEARNRSRLSDTTGLASIGRYCRIAAAAEGQDLVHDPLRALPRLHDLLHDGDAVRLGFRSNSSPISQ